MSTDITAVVLEVMALLTASGFSPDQALSGSTGTGVAPAPNTASHVAMNVWEGTITSSPGPTPRARSPISTASSPVPTPTQSSAWHSSANSLSNAVTSGPRTYQPDSRTRFKASPTSVPTSAFAAATSKNGTNWPFKRQQSSQSLL